MAVKKQPAKKKRARPRCKKRGRAATNSWLARLPPQYKLSLKALCQSIRAAWPEAKESLEDWYPSFRWRKPLVAFSATPQHCSFYVMSDKVMAANAERLQAYQRGSMSVYFAPGTVLPDKLVRRLVLARVKEQQKLPWWEYIYDM